jgi:AmiR/NasT family two-component response regulator
VDVSADGRKRLRVLIADQREEDLKKVAVLLESMGHEVIAREVEIASVGPATARSNPDVALVELGGSSDHALDLIKRIVREASCPVIALLPSQDPEFVRAAARQGVFAYIVRSEAAELQSAIEVTLERFAEFSELRGTLGRRAVIEQAKGVLMGRHGIDADMAFDMLRRHSQSTGRKVAELAAAIVDSTPLMVNTAPPKD